MKFPDKDWNRRKKELILGNLLTWGTIVIALALTVSIARVSAAEGGTPETPASAEC